MRFDLMSPFMRDVCTKKRKFRGDDEMVKGSSLKERRMSSAAKLLRDISIQSGWFKTSIIKAMAVDETVRTSDD